MRYEVAVALEVLSSCRYADSRYSFCMKPSSAGRFFKLQMLSDKFGEIRLANMLKNNKMYKTDKNRRRKIIEKEQISAKS